MNIFTRQLAVWRGIAVRSSIEVHTGSVRGELVHRCTVGPIEAPHILKIVHEN
jgi:hypothetical protein